MRIRIFLALAALFVCGVVVTLLVWLPTRSKQPQLSAANDEKTKPARVLEELHEKYARVRSVHMIATAKISIYQGRIVKGNGSFEYWAEGNRYHTFRITFEFTGLRDFSRRPGGMMG